MKDRPYPHIVGVDLAQGPDYAAVMSWRDGVRLVHYLPFGAAVTFFKGKCIVVHPDGPPYTVDPDTGAIRGS